MQAALDRHLKEKGYSFSIIKDREFFNSRKVLEGKARKLRNEGKGKLPNKSRSLQERKKKLCGKADSLEIHLQGHSLIQCGGSCHSILVFVDAKNITQ